MRPEYARRMTAAWLLLHSTLVAMAGRCCSSPDTSVTAVITGAGGEVSLAGRARVVFPKGAFADARRVEIRIGRSEEIAHVFEATVPVHPTVRTAWEVTIRTGTTCPAGGVFVELAVPAGMNVPRGQTPWAFALTFQEGGEDVLDGFEPVSTSRYSERTRTVTAGLPPEAFTSRRQADRVCEAVLVVATVPLT